MGSRASSLTYEPLELMEVVDSRAQIASTGAKKRDPVRSGVPDTWGVRSCSAETY